MQKKLFPAIVVFFALCSFPSGDKLPNDFVGCEITIEEAVAKVDKIKSNKGLDFDTRIVREITDREGCIGMVMGTNVPQGEELINITLLDLVVGVTDPDSDNAPAKEEEIETTEYDLFTTKLRDLNKLDRNLIEAKVYGEATYVIELEGYKPISHIGRIDALSSYEYIFSEQCGLIHGVLGTNSGASGPTPAEGLNAPTILDLSDIVDCESEKGVHTFNQIEIESVDYLLVSYIRKDSIYILSLFEILDESSVSSNEKIIIEFKTNEGSRVHFGGKIIKNEDLGFTLCLGDINSPGNSAKFDTPWGKVLNISNSNLMDNKISDINDSRVKVVAFGLRNPWACFAAGDDLIITDVGNIQWEELNIAPNYMETTDPLFFGWPWLEGYFDANYRNTPVDEETKNELLSSAVEPVYIFPHAKDYCAIIGGVNISNNNAWKDFSLVGDFCTGTIWAIQHTTDRVYRILEPGAIPYRISTIQEAPNGDALLGTTNGDIIRLDLP